MTGSRDVLEFGGFRLDLRRMGVWRADQPVPLEPKALDVLCHLVANRERLVTKDELLDAVWKDTFVTPNVLTRAVAQLRKSLGDDVEHPLLIETVARRGYRFIAPVTVSADADLAAVATKSSVAPLLSGASPRSARQVPWIAASAIALLVVVSLVIVKTTATTAVVSGPAEITPLTSYGDVIDAVVAPDGKYLAYVRSAQGQQSLWIRQLRGTNPIELVAPAAVSYYGITFAPDSASIYYVVRGPEPLAYPTGLLFNIPALGGMPRRLGTLFDHHPSVSPDGRRLASLRSGYPTPGQSALLITNADGGNSRTLLVVDEPEILAPGFFIAPSWSPDGDRIAVAVRNLDALGGRLLTVDVATGAVHRFESRFTSATYTSWLPDGSGIVFIAANKSDPSIEYGSRVWIQPLPDGPPRPLTTGVVQYRNATVPADGRSIVSVGSLNNAAIWRVPLKTGERPQRIPSMKEDGTAGLSWLGRDSIVFTSSEGGSPQLWTMKTDGSNRRQLTSGGWNVWPRATRDGGAIFFVSDRTGKPAIWRMNRDGHDARLLVTATEPHELTLSADERNVLFTAIGPERMDSTFQVPVDGGVATLVAKGLVHAAASPDGHAVAGLLQQSPTAAPVLATLPAAGGAVLKTFNVPVATIAGSVWWTRDGSALLYTSSDRMNVWRQPLRGGLPSVVTDFVEGTIVRADPGADDRVMLICRGITLRDAFLISGFR
jgi:Tol biopolymer transport system component/DNA-binding winged helix-turn-helix (wHTH) protein